MCSYIIYNFFVLLQLLLNKNSIKKLQLYFVLILYIISNFINYETKVTIVNHAWRRKTLPPLSRLAMYGCSPNLTASFGPV